MIRLAYAAALALLIPVTAAKAQFYVATNGSDTNPGTLAAPFATLTQAQSAMQASTTVKTTYVRAGTYHPAAIDTGGGDTVALHLVLKDKGETWSYYSPDGIGSAIIDGGSSSLTTGIKTGISVDGPATVTVNGLQLQHFAKEFLHAGNGALHTTFTNNIVHDNYDPTNTGGIAAFGLVRYTTISNNYVYNVVNHGVLLQACGSTCTSGGITGGIIQNNFIQNACTISNDCGAIYLQDYATTRSTAITITNNFIRDITSTTDDSGGRGIYLDDGTSNVTAKGNIVAGKKNTCFNIHAGAHDVFTGNICDEQSSGNESIARYETSDVATMGSGNQFEHNIVIAGSSGAGHGYSGDGPLTPATILDNAYWNYVGTAVNSTGTGGAGSDSVPTYENPQMSGWFYTVAAGSPVFNAPVTFPAIAGNWGPPGFLPPQTGTPPSVPQQSTGSPPAVTIALADDNGTSSTDKITSDPALKGTGDSSATVTITEGTTTLGTTAANSSGAWSFTPTGLSLSQHTVTASETNAFGTGSASLTFTLQSATTTSGVPAYSHIVVVVEENHDYSQIIGDTAEAPYINSLASGGMLLTKYSAITHPSEPNYFALYAGLTFGVTDDGDYSEPDPTLATVLQGAGKTFVGYVESGSPRKHNPWESFPEGTSVEQPLTAFPTSFASLPTVSFVIPNLNNDMHDGTIGQADTWLNTHIDAYAQWAKANNSLLVVTFDENDGTADGNHVATILYGAQVAAGSLNVTGYNHYSLLSTLCAASSLTCPRNSSTKAPISGFQQASATPTGPTLLHAQGTQFFDAGGKAVYLAGTHTWNDAQTYANKPQFTFQQFSDYEKSAASANFIRYWLYNCSNNGDATYPDSELPFQRSSTPGAADGNKWDLTKYNAGFFTELKQKVQIAANNGQYVDIILWPGASGGTDPFTASNNLQGVGNGTLNDSAILSYEQQYAIQILTAVGNSPNVMFEIANEADIATASWQNSMVSFIHAYESQHGLLNQMAGITAFAPWTASASTINTTLEASNADWIEPSGANPYDTNPPPPSSTGSKPVVIDDDHTGLFSGIGSNPGWSWQNFTTGNSTAFMDDMAGSGLTDPVYSVNYAADEGTKRNAMRLAIKETRQAAAQLNLNPMVPNASLSSTGFAMASAAAGEYAVYAKFGGTFTVDLTGSPSTLTATWYDVPTGNTQAAPVTGGASHTFTSPFGGDQTGLILIH